MCTREEMRVEIDKALSNNNKIRNMNLENQLGKLSEKILNNINESTPETERAIEGIKSECIARGTSIALSNQKMADIEKKVDKVDKKIDSLDVKIDNMMERLDTRYAPMASWRLMQWAGAVFGASLILYLFDKWFN